jgi:hypothetical protein
VFWRKRWCWRLSQITPLYAYLDKNGVLKGTAVEAVREMARERNMEIEIRVFSFSRGKFLIDHDLKVDGLFPAFRRSHFSDHFVVNEPLVELGRGYSPLRLVISKHSKFASNIISTQDSQKRFRWISFQNLLSNEEVH